ncbi:MAG: hypothetical protein HY859_02670 [Caulobacterales bacterium]|nr:hypothetical protein [Caulobacterales bacterium]
MRGPSPESTQMDCAYTSECKRQLEEMFDLDQCGREEYMVALAQFGVHGEETKAIGKRLYQLGSDNMVKLEQVIECIGWPERSKVGNKAADAAFLVIQHATHGDRVKYIDVFRKAARIGEASLSDLALLEDRILVGEGRKQRYGTQYRRGLDGRLEIETIEDPANVNAYRKEMGLNSLEEQNEEMFRQFLR